MNNKRNTIIGVLLLLVVMTIGYALFSETVTIEGTAKADGNLSLDLYNPDGTDGLDIRLKGVGSSGTAKIDSSRKTLKATASFDYPTAYVEIPVKVKNTGNINLYVSDIDIDGIVTADVGAGIEQISLNYIIDDFPDLITYKGIKKQDLIKINQEKIITIKAKWIGDIHGTENVIKEINFNFSIDAIQEINDNETGTPSSPYKYAIGDEITIGTEKFNVISETPHTVTMLAKNVLTRDGLTQTTSTDDNIYGVAFAELVSNKKPDDTYGYWTDDNGYLLEEYGGNSLKKDKNYGYPVNVYDENSITYKIVENYVAKLKGIKSIPENDKTSLIGRLIYHSELVELGYPSGGGYYTNKENEKWLINDQNWWTGSAGTYFGVYYVYSNSLFDELNFWVPYVGVRPVITIKKSVL